MKYDLEKVRARSEHIKSYVATPSRASEPFAKRKAEYKLDEAAVKELKKHAKHVVVVTFSAEWCPDCHRNVPVLEMISEATGIETKVFGHITRDAKDSKRKWAVPPSPPEVDEFGVTKIPFIVVLDQKGEKLGEIIENPPPGKTLEAALLEVIAK